MNSSAVQSKSDFAVLWVLISGMLYGLLGYFGIRVMNAPMSVGSMLFWRYFCATVIVYFICLQKGFSLRKNLKLGVPVILAGLFLYGGSGLLYFKASLLIGTGLAMVSFFSYPAFVILLAWMIEKKSPSKLSLGCLLIIFVGFVLLNYSEEVHFHFLGFIEAIISAILYAVYIFISKRRIQQLDTLTNTFFVCLGSVILSIILSIGGDSISVPHTLVTSLDILAIATLCTAIPILLLLKGLEHIDAGKAAILSVLEPVVTVIAGVFLLNESANLIQMIGILTVLAGSTLIQFEKTGSGGQLQPVS